MADKEVSGPSTAATKVKMQMQKMQEANMKYKNLLKLAKERIQQQDDEVKRLKADLESASRQNANGDINTIGGAESSDFVGNNMAEHGCIIVRVCQRVKVELGYREQSTQSISEEIWALIEFEQIDPDDLPTDNVPPKRIKKMEKI